MYLSQQQKLQETQKIAEETVKELDSSRIEVATLIQKNLTQLEEIEELEKENQTFLKTTLKVLYEDLDCDLTSGDLSHLYNNLRYETFNSNITEDLTKFFKYYAGKLQDCETYWFELKDLKERDNEWREIFDPSWGNLEPADGKQYFEDMEQKNDKLKEENKKLNAKIQKFKQILVEE